MRTRTIVVPIIYDEFGSVLICKMPKNRGAYPGQWALPGGGVEAGETIWDALTREIKEELNIEITKAEPWSFEDDTRNKIKADGTSELTYMIFLLFDCHTDNTDIRLNSEFEAYAWVNPKELFSYDLNPASTLTFKKKGYLA
jgi:nucleoside triphosphatase